MFGEHFSRRDERWAYFACQIIDIEAVHRRPVRAGVRLVGRRAGDVTRDDSSKRAKAQAPSGGSVGM
jgi:hypothetical protein